MIQKYYKYRAFDEFTDKIITNSSLYYSSPHDFNDPFDCQLSFRESYSKKEIRKFFIFLKKRYPNEFPDTLIELISQYGKLKTFIKFIKPFTENKIKKMGISSLSKNYNNILMWSHYADNHKGLVFEFSDTDRFNILPVIYQNSFNLLSYAPSSREESLKQFKELLTTKYSEWKYEEEIRLIYYDFQGEKKFLKEALTSIIFGLKAEQSNIHHIIQLCKDHGFEHVKFKKAQKIQGKFALEFIDIT